MIFEKKEPLIILIAGQAQSGKTTLAKFLQKEYENKFKKVVFSPYTKYLKIYIEEITKEKITKTIKQRDLLQQISSKIIKSELKKTDFFIQRQIEDIEIYSYFADVILIPDVRFPEEIKRIKEKFPYSISIGISRKNYVNNLTEKQKVDITETALNDYHDYDFEIKNNEEVNLEIVAKKIIKQINERR